MTPRCPDCHHAWAAHHGNCGVDGCECDGTAALRGQQRTQAYGTVTILARGDNLIRVTTAWPEQTALALAHGLKGDLGRDRYRSSWRYFIGRVEQVLAQGITGEWCDLGTPPP